MDQHGFFNFGPSNSHLAACARSAKIVIVEVNKSMPRCLGGYENNIHINDVDFIVEGENTPIYEMPISPITEIDEKDRKFDCKRDSRWLLYSARNRRYAKRCWQMYRAV